MSGGSFNYAYMKVIYFLEELEEEMESNIPEEDKSIISKLDKVKVKLAETSDIMKDIEWYFSGDTGSEALEEKLSKFLKK